MRRLFRFVSDGSIEVHRLVSVLLVVGGVGAQVWVDRADTGQELAWSIGATLIAALGIWWLGERRAKSIKAASLGARQETLLDVGHLLEPLTRELGRVAALRKPERRSQRDALRRAVLGAASGLSDAKLRANYFELSADGRSLMPVSDTGRAGGPKGGFKAGVKSGDAALKMVQEDGYLFCDDTDTHPPVGWEPSNNREYRTFISVTVGTPGKPSGMLTLDAPTPGELTDEDVKMLMVLGRILGVAEELTR